MKRSNLQIGSKLRSLRELKGLSRTQLAKLIGIKANAIKTYELGTRKPHLDIFADLCKALEVSPEVLLS